MGGAQAIAAMAFGTKTIPASIRSSAPANMFVTEAKRQIFGYVGIDMLAGPTEVVIIANRHSNPDYVVADMEAQLEHVGGLAVLVTNSRQLIRQVRKRVSKGYAIHVKNMDEAAHIVNRIAPEHLQILTNSPASVAKKIKNAAAIFLGPYSPTALGDYAAGRVTPCRRWAPRGFFGLCFVGFYEEKIMSFRILKKRWKKYAAPSNGSPNWKVYPNTTNRSTPVSWDKKESIMKPKQRQAKRERKSKETQIKAELNIDGQGKAKIKTNIGMLDHMLELFTFHGCFDLKLEVKRADLHRSIMRTTPTKTSGLFWANFLRKRSVIKRGSGVSDRLLPRWKNHRPHGC